MLQKGLMALIIAALIAPATAQDANEQVTAFVNVSVIPMDRERVLKDQTVVVREGRIAEIGAANRVKVPPRAVRVDGRGKFLIPGLFDMHTHLFSDGKFPDSLADDELKIMLANGVTTIRLMIGTPEHLKMRAQVAKGELLGPTMYVASPELAGRSYGDPFNGYVVTTPDEARAAVKKGKVAGYDFIKLTIAISRSMKSRRAFKRCPARRNYQGRWQLARLGRSNLLSFTH